MVLSKMWNWYVESKKQNHTQPHCYREQTGGSQRGEAWGEGKISEGDQEEQTSSFKIGHGDVR